jgi:hypothetical protein
MAGGAGAGHFTGMLNFQTIAQGRITDAFPRLGFNHCTLWANFMMGQKYNFRHLRY